MSRWSDTSDEDTRRDKRREYEGDVFYDAWRRGIDPDRAVQCASDCYYDGKSAEECVDGTAREIRRERERRQERQWEEEQQERAYYEAQQQEPEPEEQPPEPVSADGGQS